MDNQHRQIQQPAAEAAAAILVSLMATAVTVDLATY
jgi:hypothetical protein